MSSVAIIGAGITGLTAAFQLAKRGVPVTIYEASDRTGGVIRTVRQDGFMAECGPNTLLETSPRLPELFRELGLGGQMLYSSPEAQSKYILRGGALVPLPGSPLEFFGTNLFSAKAKLRLLREPFIGRSSPEVEESLAAFVVRRLGREFLDYAINPFVAGVYAGDPWKLSVREAFAKVYQLEQRYGSLIRGQILGARERKRRGGVSKQNAPKVSFLQGLGALPETLTARFQDRIHFGYALSGLEPSSGGWVAHFVTPTNGRSREHSAVLSTVPAHRLQAVPLAGPGGASFRFLGEIRHAPVSSVVLGFKREDVAHSLNGFGFLVPEAEKRHILGAIFSSTLFPNRAPAGHVTISCYLGGFRAPDRPFRDPAAQVDWVRQDLGSLLGITQAPVFQHLTVFPQAIPQYEIGYSRLRMQMEALESRCPGLFLGGNYRGGIALSDSILNGLDLGTRVADYLDRPHRRTEAARANGLESTLMEADRAGAGSGNAPVLPVHPG